MCQFGQDPWPSHPPTPSYPPQGPITLTPSINKPLTSPSTNEGFTKPRNSFPEMYPSFILYGNPYYGPFYNSNPHKTRRNPHSGPFPGTKPPQITKRHYNPFEFPPGAGQGASFGLGIGPFQWGGSWESKKSGLSRSRGTINPGRFKRIEDFSGVRPRKIPSIEPIMKELRNREAADTVYQDGGFMKAKVPL